MSNDIEYGPVLCIKGPHKGRIGYYDCEEADCSVCRVKCCSKKCDTPDIECEECEKYPTEFGKCKLVGVVFWGDMLLCSKYSLVPLDYLTNSIPIKTVLSRISELKSLIMSGNKSPEIVLELLYSEVLFCEKHIKSLYANRSGKGIFISHSSKDKQFANFLYADLIEHGYNPWLDERDIYAGQSIPREIQNALKASDYIAVVLSTNAVDSTWVEHEWATAFWDEMNSNKVKVIPLLLENCDIPPLLRTKKYADFRADYENGFDELLKSISILSEHK